VYYHHQLWSSGPHLIQGISPSRSHTVFKEAVDFKASDYAILNVGTIREFVLGLAASGQYLFDFGGFDPAVFLREWIAGRFPSNPAETRKLYEDYFAAFAVHPDSKLPLLLDGQQRRQGLRLLEFMQLYFTDRNKFDIVKMKRAVVEIPLPTPHPASALRPPPIPDGAKWTHWMGLGEMRPIVEEVDTLLRIVERQRMDFEALEKRAVKIAARLPGVERQFLEANLLAHCRIMLALSGWYEHLLRARILLSEGKRDAAARNVDVALDWLDRAAPARELLTRGEKWGHWWRLEHKMNLEYMKDSTLFLQKRFAKEKALDP